MSRKNWPTIKDMTGALRLERDSLDGTEGEEGDGTIDVRLQVSDDGWSMHIGDSSYDQDHRGHWGSGSIGHKDTVRSLRELARDLIDQARDMAATSGED